jgi:single-stranded DNA-binding protein
MSIEAAFLGSLVRDAELKTSKAGKSYLRASVRVGEGKAVQWINVTTFDESAIEAADKFLKSARVYVEGRLSLDEWKAQDGTKRSGLSCLSWHCRLAEIGRNKPKRKRGNIAQANGQATPSAGADLNDEIPF